MGLSLSFFLGLACLLVYEQVDATLPGGQSLTTLGRYAVLIPLPWLAARFASRTVARTVVRGGMPGRGVRTLLLLGSWLVPLVYAGLVLGGDLPRFAEAWAPKSYTLQFAILLSPLLLMEFVLRRIERRAVRWLDLAGIGAPGLLGPDRLPMTTFVVTAIGILVIGIDLLFLDPRLELFFGATTLGMTLGFLLIVLVFSFLLPLMFRAVIPTSREFPKHRGDDIRETARRLGFPERALLSMRTGHRMVNAALVGPLRWPRYLVLTDGLIALLDSLSLRGVVAHEVGHARAHHPALLLLLYAVVPILLVQPVWMFVMGHLESPWLLWGGGAVAVALLLSLRVVAHRFEYEADQLAAEALDGADSCVQALQRVGQLSPQSVHRASFRHPSEARRIGHMRSCEADPAYRERFWRRGRVLRAAIGALVLVGIGATIWAQSVMWPLDRSIYLTYTGRFADAQAELATFDPQTPGIEPELLEQLRAEIAAGRELGGDVVDLETDRDAFAARAWERGRAILYDRGAAAARPMLALSLLGATPDPVRRSVYLFCSAVADEEPAARVEQIRNHLFETLGVDDVTARALTARQ